MKVCVVGSGGREHALAVVLARDADVVVTPGNPGMLASCGEGVGAVSGSLTVSDRAPEDLAADLYVIGPEVPLVDGLADRLRAQGRLVFGPGADGARLEGSKAFMKQALVDAGVPTAKHGAFTDVDPAISFLRGLPGPWVVKTDGLAAGKGVLVTHDRAEAEDDIRAKLSGTAFGESGRRIVIEEGMTGPELSILAVCDGVRAVALAPAQDFKRALDGDEGPNTGGMGAYSPVPVADVPVVNEVMEKAIFPTLASLRLRDIDFRGVLYAGVMLTSEGPKILEYNVRFGDPESQVVLPRLTSSLTELLAGAAEGKLGGDPEFTTDAAVTVAVCSEGYPEAPRTGDPIQGLDAARAQPGVAVFAAGVAAGPGGGLVTAGGRVLNVTGFGPTVDDARRRAYDAAAKLDWPGLHYRTDIAALDGPD
jgi:phosphoribosylamine--glycine ligase